MIVYTSININYLPKARVLAHSVKQHNPEYSFFLVLVEPLPAVFQLEDEPFDKVFTLDQLHFQVDSMPVWMFMHTVVELCTAIKGQALLEFLHVDDKVIYLDPDIVVFDRLNELESLLDSYSILFTPHQTVPEETHDAILDNEITSLQYGIYNFGFYAASATEEGKTFAKWFRDRLLEFCYDDRPNGLFTDQKWGDLAPCFFEGLHILRSPAYNVCTWNLTHRRVTRDADGRYWVNGEPLKFYHFSGFDSGAQETMLQKYATGSPVLFEMRAWYIDRLREEGQEEYGKLRSRLNYYDNGILITDTERRLMRERGDLQLYWCGHDPFKTGQDFDYYQWYHFDRHANLDERIYEQSRAVLRRGFSVMSCLNNGKKTVLYLLHFGFEPGDDLNIGGTQAHVKDLMQATWSSQNVLTLYCHKGQYRLRGYYGDEHSGLQTFFFDFPVKAMESLISHDIDCAALYSYLLDVFCIDIVHIQHLIHHTLDIFQVTSARRIPIFYTLHDYYLLCPIIKMNGEACMRTDNEIACVRCEGEACINTLTAEQLLAWRKEAIIGVLACDEIIAPSVAARDKYVAKLPALVDRIRVIPHAEVCRPVQARDDDVSFENRKLRVAFAGDIGVDKGAKEMLQLINADKLQLIEWHFFGDMKYQPICELQQENVFLHGVYERADLPCLLVKCKIDLVGILSIWDETYCFILSEAMMAGIPVFCYAVGAMPERLRKDNVGWMLPLGTVPEEWLALFTSIRTNPDTYSEKKRNAIRAIPKTPEEMAAEYARLYKQHARPGQEKRNSGIDLFTLAHHGNMLRWLESLHSAHYTEGRDENEGPGSRDTQTGAEKALHIIQSSRGWRILQWVYRSWPWRALYWIRGRKKR